VQDVGKLNREESEALYGAIDLSVKIFTSQVYVRTTVRLSVGYI